jgi:class 3 adenylate cyclase/tetratricopeptide (TPR) repeat protein
VVFVDLVGSTSLSVRLEPEDLHDVMNTWRNCVTALIVRYGGLVTRHMGDGILALFGYPRARETDAERAVRTGLAIIEATARLDTIAGPPGTLMTRVGMATGIVIVGDLIGAGSALEWSIVGETPNFAARLQTLAEPNTLVIDDATRQLTGGMFEYRALDRVRPKGLAGSVQPWEVMWESAAESRFEALHPGASPLIGREEEADLMHRRWAKAQSGAGQVVVLVGEPGLGKSRLIAGFEEQLGNTPRSTMRLACSPNYQDTPLYPLIRYLETAANIDRTDPPAHKFSKLQRLLQNVRLDDAEVTLLADLLSVPAPAGMPSHRPPQRTQELTFKAVLHYVRALAEIPTLLIIVEDFHWADPTTMALLDAFVSEVEHSSAMLLVSSRPERGLQWSLHPHVTTQLLNGLSRSQAALLVRHVAGERRLDDALITRIAERAAGVPLFIEELTRNVISVNASDRMDSPSFSVRTRPSDSIPASLKALLAARLDQLGPGKEVAQVSSIIGREFSFEMLHAVSAFPPERLERALVELEQAGLILPDGPPPGATYVFHHVLIQEAAYTSMLRDRRRGYHLRYAECLEQDPGGPAATAPEMIAGQFAEAGAAEKSIEYYLKAAARATGRFALTEIVGYLQKGLDQIALLPDTPSKQRRELELQVALGRALREHRGAGDEEVRNTFERAHQLCHELDETRLLLHVHDGLANYYLAHAELDKVAEYGERTWELGRRTGDRSAMALAHRSRGHARLLLGRFREAREDFEQAINIYDGEIEISRDPKVSACSALGICLTALGLPEAGSEMSFAAIRHAEMLAQPISLNLGLRRACVQAMMRRDADEVRELSARLLHHQSDYETFRGSQEGMFFSTWAHLQTRRDPEQHERLRTTLDRFENERFFNLLPFFMITAAEVLGYQGDRTGAQVLLQRAAKLVEKTSERWCEAEIPRLSACFTSDPGAATKSLEKSLSLAREQGALLWEVRAAADLARLLNRQGQREAAYQALASVVASTRDRGSIPDFVSSRELLEEIRGGRLSLSGTVG